MLGHEGVVRALTIKLRQQVPAAVERLSKGLPAGAELPRIDPQDIHATEVDVIGKGRFPTLMVVQEGTGIQQSTRQVDVFSDHDEYAFRYRCRILLWATGTGVENTELMRKRLMLALRIALLSDRMIHHDETTGEHAYVDHGYLREQFSELAQDSMGKLLGGGYIEVEVVSHEVLDLGGTGNRAQFQFDSEAVQDAPTWA